MAELVLREDRGGLAVLTLNRPEKLNSISQPLCIELRAHLEDIARRELQLQPTALSARRPRREPTGPRTRPRTKSSSPDRSPPRPGSPAPPPMRRGKRSSWRA